jgi:hypothetical protein
MGWVVVQQRRYPLWDITSLLEGGAGLGTAAAAIGGAILSFGASYFNALASGVTAEALALKAGKAAFGGGQFATSPSGYVFSNSGGYIGHFGSPNASNILIQQGSRYPSLSQFSLFPNKKYFGFFGPDLNEGNRRVLSKVVNYLVRQAGIGTKLDISSIVDNGALAHYNPTSHHIEILPGVSGKVSPLLDDVYNLRSTAEHELLHKGQRNDNINYLSHGRVYSQQIQSSTFKNTTMDYQGGIVGSFMLRLLNAISHNLDVGALIKDFNSSKNTSGWKIADYPDQLNFWNATFKGKVYQFDVSEILTNPAK